MPNFPIISGFEAVRALQKLGFIVIRQKGSYIILRKGSQGCVVPNHREIKWVRWLDYSNKQVFQQTSLLRYFN